MNDLAKKNSLEQEELESNLEKNREQMAFEANQKILRAQKARSRDYHELNLLHKIVIILIFGTLVFFSGLLFLSYLPSTSSMIHKLLLTYL